VPLLGGEIFGLLKNESTSRENQVGGPKFDPKLVHPKWIQNQDPINELT
jgi:hypothetical protein